MAIEIFCEEPTNIDLNDLKKIQKDSFDEIYLEKCTYGLEEHFKGSSFVFAYDKNKLVGYLMYQKPGDASHDNGMDWMYTYLEWRKSVEIGNEDKTMNEYITHCQKDCGIKTEKKHKKSFAADESLLGINDDLDSHLQEIAVIPGYRGKRIASLLIKAFHENTPEGTRYLYTRDNIKMNKIARHKGYVPLFEFGPLYKDGALGVIFAGNF